MSYDYTYCTQKRQKQTAACSMKTKSFCQQIIGVMLQE